MISTVEARSIAASAIANGWLRPPPVKPARVITPGPRRDIKELRRLSLQEPRRKIGMKMLRFIAKRYQLAPRLLLAKCRRAKYVLPRQMLFSIARELMNATHSEIERIFLRVNGTSLYACTELKRRIETEPKVKAEYQELKAALEEITETD